MQIGTVTLVAIVLLVLKLAGVIAWSWLWVLSPLWIPTVIIFCGYFIFYAAENIFKARD